MGRRGGVKRISAMIYDEIQKVVKVLPEEALREVGTYVEYRMARTVTVEDALPPILRDHDNPAAHATRGWAAGETMRRPPRWCQTHRRHDLRRDTKGSQNLPRRCPSRCVHIR
ncbi:hypothetical protein J3F83DRAFT_373114 [Trichoderma novae-zelandiae]